MRKIKDIVATQTLSSVLSVCLGALCLWAFFDPESFGMADGVTLAFLGIGSRKKARKEAGYAADRQRGYVDQGLAKFGDYFSQERQDLSDLGDEYGSFTDKAKRDMQVGYGNTAEGKSIMTDIKENRKAGKRMLASMGAYSNMSDEAMLSGLDKINMGTADQMRNYFAGSDRRTASLRAAILAGLSGKGNTISGRANLRGTEAQMALNYSAQLGGQAQAAYGQSMQMSQAATEAFSQLIGKAASAATGGAGGAG